VTTTRGASAAAIQHHYDVGNDFYKLWLDPTTMSYTAALFGPDPERRSLDAAQQAKVDHHVQAARAARQPRVLDIGCGWGNMLFSLVRRHGVAHATGLTLSREQASYIAQQNDSRVEVKLESYVDHTPSEAYDAIVSVESIEAFARFGLSSDQKVDVYRELFAKAHAWLRPAGWFSLQMITYGNAPNGSFDSFIAEESFRESDLPRLAEICEACDGLFSVEALQNDRADYARTLRFWLNGLREHREEALAIVGPEVYRRYGNYLRLCVHMFESGACDLHRVALRRIDSPRVHQRAAQRSKIGVGS
jgi:cyclopropane-fatty-acyl-phospholipid synthase